MPDLSIPADLIQHITEQRAAFEAWARSEHVETRRFAIEGLAALRRPEDLNLMRELLQEESDQVIWATIFRYLGEFGELADAWQIEMALTRNSESTPEAIQGIRAIGKLLYFPGEFMLGEYLVPNWWGMEANAEACYWLGKSGSEEHAGAMREVFERGLYEKEHEGMRTLRPNVRASALLAGLADSETDFGREFLEDLRAWRRCQETLMNAMKVKPRLPG